MQLDQTPESCSSIEIDVVIFWSITVPVGGFASELVVTAVQSKDRRCLSHVQQNLIDPRIQNASSHVHVVDTTELKIGKESMSGVSICPACLSICRAVVES